MLTLEEYTAEYFGGNKSELARYWGVAPQRITEWGDKFVFYVVGEDHLRVNVNNIRKVGK